MSSTPRTCPTLPLQPAPTAANQLPPEVQEYAKADEENGELKADNLGEFMNGWKIQGYWYDDFVKFLYACAKSMTSLTYSKYENFIEMEEEQGFKFEIRFFVQDGEPAIEVGYVPMVWDRMVLKENEGEVITKI